MSIIKEKLNRKGDICHSRFFYVPNDMGYTFAIQKLVLKELKHPKRVIENHNETTPPKRKKRKYNS